MIRLRQRQSRGFALFLRIGSQHQTVVSNSLLERRNMDPRWAKLFVSDSQRLRALLCAGQFTVLQGGGVRAAYADSDPSGFMA